MLKFSRKTDYGLIAMRHMAAQPVPEVSSAREIADTYGISYELVSKILQTLKRQRLIESVQGVAGGYRIARDISAVSLLEFIEMLEGRLGVVECTRGDAAPPCAVMGECNIILPMRELNTKILRVLKETTLDELFHDAGPLPEHRPAPMPVMAAVAK